MTSPATDDEAPPLPEEAARVLSVHLGPSANCSSIGSFVDFLFVSSIAGGALVAVLAAMMDARRDAAPPNADEADEEE